MAQRSVMGPWFGGLSENGMKDIGLAKIDFILTRGPYLKVVNACIRAYDATERFDPYDLAHRPHFQELANWDRRRTVGLKEGYTPVPRSLEENEKRNPWPVVVRQNDVEGHAQVRRDAVCSAKKLMYQHRLP
jgi:hypothetical protein